MLIPKTHVSYQSAAFISERLLPLLMDFYICDFSYVRVYSDLSRIHLGSNAQWIQHFYQHAAGYHAKSGLLDEQRWQSGYAPIHLIGCQSCICDARNFGLGDGVVISQYNGDYNELAFFTLPVNANKECLVMLLNNIDLLNQFTSHFKKAAGDLLSNAEKMPITLPFLQHKETTVHPLSITEDKRRNFLANLADFPDNNTCYFTAKEQECANHLRQGCCPKQIAVQMDISVRTVEKHLQQLKTKTHSRTIIQLLAKLLTPPMLI